MSEQETPALDGLVIGILGGTGPQGRGLARRFAMAGHQVIIGSRNHDRANGVAREIGHDVRGLANRDAAREASLPAASAARRNAAGSGHHRWARILLATTLPGSRSATGY